MNLRWPPLALRDLRKLRAFIAHDRPDAAARVAEHLLAAAESLQQFSELGFRMGPGRERELPAPGTGFVLVCQAETDAVVILNVFPGARPRPGAGAP